ncbi:MAG: hypothetical protein AB8B95_14790 [Pseudohongiellaceae bacterium]
MIVALVSQFFLFGVLVALPVIAVVILLALSVAFKKWAKASAALSLLPGFLIPGAVLLGFLNGTAPVWLLIFDWIIFGWVVVSAIKTLVAKDTAHDSQINQ